MRLVIPDVDYRLRGALHCRLGDITEALNDAIAAFSIPQKTQPAWHLDTGLLHPLEISLRSAAGDVCHELWR
jgi:hypothetical protein